MPSGTITRIVADRGFGFILAEDGQEYFFHRSGLDASLDFDRLLLGTPVSFTVEPSLKRPRAGAGPPIGVGAGDRICGTSAAEHPALSAVRW